MSIYHLYLTKSTSHIIALMDREEGLCQIDKDYISSVDMEEDQLKFILDIAQTAIAVLLKQLSFSTEEKTDIDISRMN